MGWARQYLLGKQNANPDMSDCRENIKQLKISLMQMHEDDQSQDEELMQLRQQNDELKLYMAALIRILTTKGLLSEQEIESMVNIIDGEDGAMDRKIRE